MLNVNPSLLHYGISTTSPLSAVQTVRELIASETDGNQCGAASKLIAKLIGANVEFTDTNAAYITAQAVVETAIKAGGTVDSAEELLAAAQARCSAFMGAPANSWMFAKPERTADNSTQVAVAAGIEVTVAVKADGKIKKGGKEVLAMALYKLHVTDSATPVDNQGFIAILMKELGMSKAGATTYNYNMKKKFGGTIAAKPKKAK